MKIATLILLLAFSSSSYGNTIVVGKDKAITSITKGMPGLFWLISPNTAAKTILKAAANGKENIYVPARWALVGLVIRMIPSFIFKKLNV